VELIFLKAPAGATPEDQLLVQFQGMIAEYERAQNTNAPRLLSGAGEAKNTWRNKVG